MVASFGPLMKWFQENKGLLILRALYQLRVKTALALGISNPFDLCMLRMSMAVKEYHICKARRYTQGRLVSLSCRIHSWRFITTAHPLLASYGCVVPHKNENKIKNLIFLWPGKKREILVSM